MAILCIGHFLVDFMIGVWPIYKTIAHLDLAKAGLMIGLCSLFGEGMQVFFGPLSDRGYRKKLILFGILMTIGSTLYAYTDNYYFLFSFLLMTYIGSGAFHPSAVGLISSLPGHRKALLMTVFACGGALGLASSQIIFTHSFDLFSGHTLFLALPTIVLIALAFSRPFVGVHHVHAAQPKKNKMALSLFIKCLRNRHVLFLFFSQVCNQSIMWGLIFLLPDVLISRGHESWLAYGTGHFCLIMGGALMMIPSGYLADKYSARSVIIWATIIGGSFYFLFLFGFAFSSSLVLVLLFLIGAFLAVVNPVSIALGNRFMPENPGVISALLMGVVWCISETVGPGGSGLMTKFFEEDAPAKALTWLGLLLIANAFIALKLPKQVPSEETILPG
jgi:FSR family fosmidomycin resistance protein-like MFS transporter